MSSFIVLVSLLVLTFLLSRNIRWGLYWTIFTLPLYELGRIHLGPIPTTVVELNILLLFGWWMVSRITRHESRGTKNNNTAVVPDFDLPASPSLGGESSQKNQKQKDSKSFFVYFSFWIPAFARMTKNILGDWFWLIILWLVIATFSMVISPNLREAAGVWKAYFVEPILFLIVFVDVFLHTIHPPYPPLAKGGTKGGLGGDGSIKSVFNILIVSGTVVAVVGIVQKFTGWWIPNEFWAAEATRRVTSVFPFPNAVGLYLAPISIIALTTAVSKLPNLQNLFRQQTTDNRQQNKIFLLIVNCLLLTAFILMFLAILFARSRGALLGVGAGIIFLGLVHKGKRSWYWLGITAAILFILSTPLKHALQQNPSSFTGGDSNKIRVEIWSESLQLLKERPFWGAGLSGYQSLIAPYHQNPSVEIYKYPHNVFLNFWTEMGIAGLILLVFIICCFYRTLFLAITATKSQITSTKSQTNPNDQNPKKYLELFKISNLKFVWNLEFGIWNLPNHPNNQEASRFLYYALGSAFTTLLAHGLVDVPYFKNDLSALFWIFIGISIILRSSGDYGTNILAQKDVSI